MVIKKERSPRNKTITISTKEREVYKKNLLNKDSSMTLDSILNKTICADLFDVIDKLPKAFVDVLIIDPPYNLDKNFKDFHFSQSSDLDYLEYLRSWFSKVLGTLKPNGTVYLCGDWKSSIGLYQVMQENLKVLNRITWQREKGRGAKTNWKNATEDIWFGVRNSNNYYFNVDAVKQKRKVITPYRDNGKPKDWEQTKEGKFRMTYPSNFWNDISIPYWSMPENTEHPTQKPEKLIAKLILASCPEGGIVLDPFLGSGTTSVTAKKLKRNYVGIEMNEDYCLFAEKRLDFATKNNNIQGYTDGIFWERNTGSLQKKLKEK